MIPGLLGRPAAGAAASLLFDEGFLGTTQAYYEGRGWYDGTAGIVANNALDGYEFETDATLGRNVMFAHWATIGGTNGGDLGAPGPNGNAWRLLLDTTQTNNGATMYLLTKFHNWLTRSSVVGGIHYVRFARGFGAFTATNANGQMDLDITSNLGTPDGNTQELDTTTHAFPPSGNPQTPTKAPYWTMGSSNHLMHASNVLSDDIWYEIACYCLPSSGDLTTDGILKVQLRQFGQTPWTTVMDGTNIGTAFLGPIPSIVNVQYFMLTPYISSGVRWIADIRQYWATIRLYSGNVLSLL